MKLELNLLHPYGDACKCVCVCVSIHRYCMQLEDHRALNKGSVVKRKERREEGVWAVHGESGACVVGAGS